MNDSSFLVEDNKDEAPLIDLSDGELPQSSSSPEEYKQPKSYSSGTYQAQAFRLEQAEIKACQLVDITNYKTYAKGLMDIALLTSNANQLRQVVELCGSFKYVLVALLCLSILLQVLATALLMVERIKCKGEDWANCVRSNAALL